MHLLSPVTFTRLFSKMRPPRAATALARPCTYCTGLMSALPGNSTASVMPPAASSPPVAPGRLKPGIKTS